MYLPVEINIFLLLRLKYIFAFFYVADNDRYPISYLCYHLIHLIYLFITIDHNHDLLCMFLAFMMRNIYYYARAGSSDQINDTCL